MFCPNCGNQLPDTAKFCGSCGAQMNAQPQAEAQPATEPYQQAQYQQASQPYQQTYQQAQPAAVVTSDKSKIAAGLLAIFLGALGIHKFYLGYQKEGIIMLLVSLLTCGIGLCVMEIIALIEGILYLSKSDAEFEATYVQGQKTWF